jgi:hypothetical protein
LSRRQQQSATVVDGNTAAPVPYQVQPPHPVAGQMNISAARPKKPTVLPDSDARSSQSSPGASVTYGDGASGLRSSTSGGVSSDGGSGGGGSSGGASSGGVGGGVSGHGEGGSSSMSNTGVDESI